MGNGLPWLRKEFNWGERTARNFIRVAETFGKSASLADLKELTITGEALYLLALAMIYPKPYTKGTDAVPFSKQRLSYARAIVAYSERRLAEIQL